jgi:phage recombination protein Bet
MLPHEAVCLSPEEKGAPMSNEVLVQDWTREKIDLIKSTVAKGATDLEFDLFLHACKRTGLDPLMKQIYAIKRKNTKTGKDDMSIQTGIDGYRLIADRTGKYAGSDEPTYVLGEDGFPDIASVTVYKLVGGVRCPFSSSARWHEYVQESSPMWKKMPFLMLAKCAEALALRKAFPAELSGVYTHEEMMQADTEPKASVMDHKREASAKIAELKVNKVPNDIGPIDMTVIPTGQEDAQDTGSNAGGDAAKPDNAPAPPPIAVFKTYLDKLAMCDSIKMWSDIQNGILADEQDGLLTTEQTQALRQRAEDVKKKLGKK